MILDWPFDVICIEGDSPEEVEENKFKYAVNMMAGVERLRDFVGLENANLLRIVSRAMDFVMAQTPAGRKPPPEKVQAWLQQHVKWGLLHCPDTPTVKRHMDNWAALQKCPAALDLIEAAVNRWGRDNLLDWPTKLGIIVKKTDATSLGYVVESLYARMWRLGQKDPYSAIALGEVISEILWGKAYMAALFRKYPALVSTCGHSEASTPANVSAAAVQSMKTAQVYLDSPLKFFLKTEGPDKDPIWLQTLPNEALRQAMKHCTEVVQGFYKPEIAGALKQPKGERYNMDHFHKGSRVSTRFFEPFEIAYDSLAGPYKSNAVSAATADGATSAATVDGATGIGEEVASDEKKKTDITQIQITAFREQCEHHCQQEIDGRVVLLVAEGTDVEVFATVTKTRLYQNLAEAATVMGVYDVKNARMCNIYEGTGLTHVEPALDEADFERYVKACWPLLEIGRDVMWVLGGRTDSNRVKIKRILAKNFFLFQVFHLCYNTKQMMQYGHFKRQRGVANSRSYEMLYMCYKGRLPKQLVKTRMYVDGGSTIFSEVMRNVPVLAQKHHALVTRDIREKSLQTMTGKDVTEVEAADPEHQGTPPLEDEEAATAGAEAATAEASPQKALVVAAIKRRKLYRQLTGTEVPWFPHDNDVELLKELCHEAGRPRWVFFGTPAGGAGIHGCIEMGSSVLGLCFDEHHRTSLPPFLVQRAVEAMLGSITMVFQNESLVARASSCA